MHTRSHLKQKIHKQWITDTLLNSIRNKQKMYRMHFLSKDLDKVGYYKKYSNTLNKAGVALTLLVFTLDIKSVIACLRQVRPFCCDLP